MEGLWIVKHPDLEGGFGVDLSTGPEVQALLEDQTRDVQGEGAG